MDGRRPAVLRLDQRASAESAPLPVLAEPGLADKVAALRRPACYPQPVGAVHAVETHMSWVFLTERHAWKLKKPVRFGHLDFGSLAARRFYCLEELRLNRRLAPTVYLDVVPLTAQRAGVLRIGGDGVTVEWLVQMRRLAPELMLDAMLARKAATAQHMRGIAQRLAAFQAAQPPAPVGARAYRALLLRQVDEYERGLCEPALHLPVPRVRDLCERQRAILAHHAHVFEQRVPAGRVLDGHGDLRPEHVWLGEPPCIIDALEFSTELRIQDAADEVGFLALECERAHGAALARELLAAWREASGDAAPPGLVDFHQSCRACNRARLAIWHLHEERYRGSPQWRRRALRYLALAARHLRAAALGLMALRCR